jgi:hypothetical protein
MSRTHILKRKFNMTYDDLRRLYHELGTINAVVTRLGVSRRSVINWMREGNIEGIHHRTIKPARATALFAWIKEHPGCRLPTTIAGIAALTGLSKDLIKQALARRARATRRALLEMPVLSNQSGSIVDIRGRRLPLGAIASYDIKLNWYTLEVTVYGDLRDGSDFEARISRTEYKRLCTQSET